MPTQTAAAFAALLLAALPAFAQGGRPLTEEEAHRLLPRADLAGLTAEQRGTLMEVAGDTFNYAGCNSTLAACLRADVKDKHAPRMAKIASLLIQDGYPASQVIYQLEQYYSRFDKAKRSKLKTDDCAIIGDPKAPVTVVEYSDFQCPHCATVVKPLHELAEGSKGKVRLCPKYFPLPGHPRSPSAAAAAEYARAHGKFWPMFEMMFARQDELEDVHLKAYAKKAGLDGDAMLKEIYAGKYDKVIEAHKREGMEAGVRATPSVYFNGRYHSLPIKPDYLARSAEDELEWARNNGAWDKE